jgi:hypothetical protein
MTEDELLAALEEGERENPHAEAKVCQVCAAIAGIENAEVKAALTRAAGGTIGRDKFVAIMHRQGYNVGKRHLVRHRQEGHRP